MGTHEVSAPTARPAWYALEGGSWRDYVTLLHPPYTAWHLSYVVIGGCLAPVVAWGRLGAAVLAFALAVGLAHTRIHWIGLACGAAVGIGVGRPFSAVAAVGIETLSLRKSMAEPRLDDDRP